MVGKLIELNKTFHGVRRGGVTACYDRMRSVCGWDVGGKRRRPLFKPFLIPPNRIPHKTAEIPSLPSLIIREPSSPAQCIMCTPYTYYIFIYRLK